MEAVEQDVVLECPEHGFRVPEVRLNGPHFKAVCSICQHHLKFVPKTAVWRSLVR